MSRTSRRLAVEAVGEAAEGEGQLDHPGGDLSTAGLRDEDDQEGSAPSDLKQLDSRDGLEGLAPREELQRIGHDVCDNAGDGGKAAQVEAPGDKRDDAGVMRWMAKVLGR